MTGVFVRRIDTIPEEERVVTIAESGDAKIVVITRKRGRKPGNQQSDLESDSSVELTSDPVDGS